MKLNLTTTNNFSPMGAVLRLVSLKLFFLLIGISRLFSKGKYKFLSITLKASVCSSAVRVDRFCDVILKVSAV